MRWDRDYGLCIKLRKDLGGRNPEIKWLTDGHKNIKFFHAFASSRKRVNVIHCLSIGNYVVEDPNLNKDEVTKHFETLYNCKKIEKV